MPTRISAFNFAPHSIRVSLDDRGEPWFLANDVCAILGYSNPRDAIAKHCKEGGVAKRDTLTSSGEQEMTYINEPNLYRLIIKSRKPEAEKFEAFVMEEVLPTIRKTGKFQLVSQQPKSNRITDSQYVQLTNAIERALMGWCWSHSDQEKLMNTLRLSANVQNIRDLTQEQFAQAMQLVELHKGVAYECLKVLNDMKEHMLKEVIMSGLPHTSQLTKAYRKSFGELPSPLDWTQVCKQLGVLINDKPIGII